MVFCALPQTFHKQAINVSQLIFFHPTMRNSNVCSYSTRLLSLLSVIWSSSCGVYILNYFFHQFYFFRFYFCFYLIHSLSSLLFSVPITCIISHSLSFYSLGDFVCASVFKLCVTSVSLPLLQSLLTVFCPYFMCFLPLPLVFQSLLHMNPTLVSLFFQAQTVFFLFKKKQCY